MVYRGDKPPIWATDEDTQAHTGVTKRHFTFRTREMANRVMAEVPSLFDMDDDGELALNIREICMPGQSGPP